MLGLAYFDLKSESIQQRVDRLAKEKENGTRVEMGKGVNGTSVDPLRLEGSMTSLTRNS